MTLKYESEILFDLMKRDGDVTPSDVLPYESELKEKYLHQVEGAYPKLQDYRPEWLNYNLNAHLPADFPVESVANVTSASFNNVVPYAYGSAILKGQTLINLSPFTRNNGVYELNASTNTSSHVLPMKLQQNKQYIFIFKLTNSQSSENSNYIMCRGMLTDGAFKEFGRKTQILPNGRHWFMLSSNEGDIDSIFVGTNFDVTLSDTMIIEYQDGMENWDIPYFEGMTSVKMPVLTTTGKNLFDGELEMGTIISTTGELVDSTIEIRSKNFIPINDTFTISRNDAHGALAVRYYDINKNFLGVATEGGINDGVNNKTYVPLANTHYAKFKIMSTNLSQNIQIEYGTQPTTYEPFKSNILRTSEDVVLKGIGDVQDELDLITGELTQRIGEVVLDGSEDWRVNDNTTTNTISFRYNISDGMAYAVNPKYMCNNFSVLKQTDALNTKESEWTFYNENGIPIVYFNVLRSKLLSEDLSGWKLYLQANPITIQYELSTESIKTVDLTVTDQDGNTESIIRPIEGTMHVSTSSQTIPPLLDMSVPVEATSQNLMSFANILEEE